MGIKEERPITMAEVVELVGDTDKGKITRNAFTGLLLNALPKNEGDAFRELIRASG